MERTPLAITMDLTSRCNLRCGYCCFFSNEAECNCNDLSTSEVIDKLKEAEAAGVYKITLRGGEVMTRRDLPQIIEAIAAHRMRFSFLTNGYNTTSEFVSLVKQTGRCDYVKISLDGTQELHDAVRGCGSHAVALRAIKTYKNYEIPVVVTMAVHKKNYQHLEECIKYMLNLPIDFITLSGVISCENAEEFALTDDEFREAMHLLVPLIKLDSKRFLQRGMVSLWTHWQNIAGGNFKEKLSKCPSSSQSVIMRADGAWGACTEMSELAENNVSLMDFWNKSELMKKMREPRNKMAFEECANCPWRESCPGRCYFSDAVFTGRKYDCPMAYQKIYGDLL